VNGKKAKALRRKIYGESSLRVKRTYVQLTATNKKDKKIAAGLVNTGLRGKYQMAKHPERCGALFQVNG
jgi:hypothetical protein